VRPSSLVLRPEIDLFYQPRKSFGRWVWFSGGMVSGRGKVKYSEKTLPQWHFVLFKVYMEQVSWVWTWSPRWDTGDYPLELWQWHMMVVIPFALGFDFRQDGDFSSCHRAQTVSGAYPASCHMDTVVTWLGRKTDNLSASVCHSLHRFVLHLELAVRWR
jgi:hypothetical protein